MAIKRRKGFKAGGSRTTPAGIAKGLARKVLKLKGQGSNVPDTTARAARVVLQNKGTESDVQLLRKHLGISRSGAGAIGKAMKGATGLTSGLLNISRDISMLGQEGQSGAAAARLSLTAVSGVADAVGNNKKALVGIGENVAKQLGKDPALASKFVNGLARVSRLAGVLGAGFAIGAQLVSAFINQQKRAGEAGLAAHKARMAFAAGDRGAAVEEQAQREAELDMRVSTALADNPFLILGTKEYFGQRVSEAAAKRKIQLIQERTKERQILNQSGAGQEALAAFAASRGLPVSLLSKRDSNTVLDKLAEETFKASDTSLEVMIGDKLNQMNFLERASYEASGGWALREEWAEEIRKRNALHAEDRLAGLKKKFQEELHKKSPEQRIEEDMYRDERLATHNAFRSRHVARTLD
ncbi:MAG: hypothetical protein GY851_03425 [bacterium]|nr:hypothetical protein [bacterium]